MTEDLSRRDLIAGSAGAALVAAAPTADATDRPDLSATADLAPLTSRSGVYTPARGEAVLQFGFDFPEPSAIVGGYRIGFRVQTFENAYAIDPTRTRVSRDGPRVRLVCEGLLGAGGQLRASGGLVAEFTVSPDGAVEWRVEATAASPVKSITTVVRGLPRGELSVSANPFVDHKDDERIFEYPQLFGGMSTPLVVLKAADGRLTAISARQSEVRPARFFFQPGPDGYRVELIHEQAGWARALRVQTATWRIAPAADYAQAASDHFAHLERAYALPRWDARPDAPDWMRKVRLVLSIHAMHWTGYVFNDYARTLEILRWAAERIDPREVLVFLPAWDGRYYWNYPDYLPDPRLGGAVGFARLVREAQALGYRIAPMFGANAANRGRAGFKAAADAPVRHVDGDVFDLSWVDWDNDRRNEGWGAFMNLGVESWRRWLGGRISAVIDQFGVDAYFLDIAGAWENNPDADMYEGTRRLVAELAARHPGRPAIGEMLYDAQMAFIPMSQVTRYPLYPAGQDAYGRAYQHLSRPAPGRGSTGVHEAGFSTWKPEITPDQRAIPTLTFVDDTFTRERDTVAAYIAAVRARSAR